MTYNINYFAVLFYFSQTFVSTRANSLCCPYFSLGCNAMVMGIKFGFKTQFIDFVQPVKIIDPHLVSSFFDNYNRVYLHCTTELENRSTWVAECSLNIQVSTELEDGICLVEHLQTQHLSISAGSKIQYTFPQVS